MIIIEKFMQKINLIRRFSVKCQYFYQNTVSLQKSIRHVQFFSFIRTNYLQNKLKNEIQYLNWHFSKQLKNIKSKASKQYKEANRILTLIHEH